MTVETSTATLAWLRSRADRSLSNLYDLGNRLSVWLVVGNAAALGLAFQQMVQRPQLVSALSTSAALFFAGLASAFSGLAVGYFASVRAMLLTEVAVDRLGIIVQNQALIDKLDAQYPEHPVPEDAPLYKAMEKANDDTEALRKPLNRVWRWVGGAIALLGLSALLFALGATTPLRNAGAFAAVSQPVAHSDAVVESRRDNDP